MPDEVQPERRRAVREKFCTSTIFALLVTAFIASCVKQVPGQVWWLPLDSSPDIPLIVWILISVIAPFGMGALVAVGLWHLASACCAKLRGAK